MNPIVNDLRDELRAADIITRNALGVVTFDQKCMWGTANYHAAVTGEGGGVVRVRERRAAIEDGDASTLFSELCWAHIIIANVSRLLSWHQTSFWNIANHQDGVAETSTEDPVRFRARSDVLRRAFEMEWCTRIVSDYAAMPSLTDAVVNGANMSRPSSLDVEFDMHAFLRRRQAFSESMFGPGRRTAGICDHIRKELKEVEAAPDDVTEWIDVILLGLDGAGRTGATPEQITAALAARLAANERRAWPDWRSANLDRAIEHIPAQGRTA